MEIKGTGPFAKLPRGIDVHPWAIYQKSGAIS